MGVLLSAVLSGGLWVSVAEAAAIRDLPGLTGVRVTEKTTYLYPQNCGPNDSRLVNRLANMNSSGDFVGATNEY